jgi:hypothetical protein
VIDEADNESENENDISGDNLMRLSMPSIPGSRQRSITGGSVNGNEGLLT